MSICSRWFNLRSRIHLVGALAALVSASLATGQAPPARSSETISMGQAASAGDANSYLSFLPAGVDSDFDAWRVRLKQVAQTRSRRGVATVYKETEDPGVTGFNDQVFSAEQLPALEEGGSLLIRGQVLTVETDLGDFDAMGSDLGGAIPSAVDLATLGLSAGCLLYTSPSPRDS